jgi:hypothetical protein
MVLLNCVILCSPFKHPKPPKERYRVRLTLETKQKNLCSQKLAAPPVTTKRDLTVSVFRVGPVLLPVTSLPNGTLLNLVSPNVNGRFTSDARTWFYFGGELGP